tara:strand:- start:100 stop:297 length:198 start_codon:yes stop_codon:yes gene_type:complete
MNYIDFLNEYRIFRARVREELGSKIEESCVVQLFNLYMGKFNEDTPSNVNNFYAFDPFDNDCKEV